MANKKSGIPAPKPSVPRRGRSIRPLPSSIPPPPRSSLEALPSLVDDDDWSLAGVLIDRGSWLRPDYLSLPISSISQISWAEQSITLDMLKGGIYQIFQLERPYLTDQYREEVQAMQEAFIPKPDWL